jgi:hypothetical protein
MSKSLPLTLADSVRGSVMLAQLLAQLLVFLLPPLLIQGSADGLDQWLEWTSWIELD